MYGLCKGRPKNTEINRTGDGDDLTVILGETFMALEPEMEWTPKIDLTFALIW